MIFVLFVLPSCMSVPAYGQHGWPIEPVNQGHPIGNSFGEFQDFGTCLDKNGYLMEHCIFHHSGIDILGTPMYEADGSEDMSAPWVRVTVGGKVEEFLNIPDCDCNYSSIRDTNGVIYRYGHLEYNSYDPAYLINKNQGTVVNEGSAIAKLFRWNECDYHHLHYEMKNGSNFLNPLAGITPHQDLDSPQIAAIFFAKNNSGPWVPLRDVGSSGCTLVNGEVDIIAKILDRDRAGSNHPGTKTVWVHNVRWRACPESNPNCPWNDTYPMDNIPESWMEGNNEYTSAYFSVNDPWVSDSDYCQETWLYAVVTNFKGGVPDQAGCWDTKNIPDGRYLVSVEASDFTNNPPSVLTVTVCVDNSRLDAPKGLRIQ
jgi:hypothetical protein